MKYLHLVWVVPLACAMCAAWLLFIACFWLIFGREAALQVSGDTTSAINSALE